MDAAEQRVDAAQQRGYVAEQRVGASEQRGDAAKHWVRRSACFSLPLVSLQTHSLVDHIITKMIQCYLIAWRIPKNVFSD